MHLDDRLNGQGPWSIVHIVPFVFYVCHLAKMAHSNSKFSLFPEGERAI